MSFKDIPIRRKLITIILLISVAVMVLARVAFFTYEFLTFRQATTQQLSTVGGVIAANSTAALAFDNQDDAREILAALRTEPHITVAALYDARGKLFAKYPADLADALFPTMPGQLGYHYQHLSLVGFQRVTQGGRDLGTLYLQLDTGSIMHRWFQNSIGIAVAVITVALVVAYLLSRTLQRQISEPILSLAETARAISDRQDFSVRAKKLGGDELGLLTDAFNQMLSQIQKLNQELEQRVAKRTAELEIANKELEAFSYSVSHDLRAPLRAVDGFSQAVLEDYGAQLPEEGRHYLKTIREGAQRMGMLIDDLLTFSRLSRLPLKKQAVDMTSLAHEALHELNGQRDGRQIDVRINDLPRCEGDSALLKQVWINLLSNAIKYTQKREAAVVEVGSREDKGEKIYFVSDNGTGFDMKYAHKLFGVFQRLHRADEFEGTGVGLAIAQRVVHRHGGRIWAQAAVDRGAEFYFTVGTEGDS